MASPPVARRARARGVAVRAAAFVALVPALAGCGLFGDDDPAESTSVFDVGPGTCLKGPTTVEADLTEVDAVPCEESHTQEAYAVTEYVPPAGAAATGGEDVYPGEEALTDYADRACAEEFESYVGVSYLDSELFFTYLLPSPQSWEEGDRDVLCVATDAGRPLEGSVKGSKS